MLWIFLIVLIVLIFAVLLYFLQYILTRNINKATGHLQSLSKDYVLKEEEANRILQNAQKEAKGILAKETQAAKEIKENLLKETAEEQKKIIQEANQKGLEIAEKAKRNADFILSELDQRIDERAKEKVNALIQQVIPKEFLQNIHQQWMNESEQGDFNLKYLKLPEEIKEVKVISAFPLTDQQQSNLKKRLKAKIDADAMIKIEIDSTLIVGFIIMIGGVVMDASLKYKIQKAMLE